MRATLRAALVVAAVAATIVFSGRSVRAQEGAAGEAKAAAATSADPQREAPRPYEAPWEYSPYRVHVWFVDDGSRAFSPEALETIRRRLLDEIEIAIGPGWNASAGSAPEEVAAAVRAGLETLTVEKLEEISRGWWFAGVDGAPIVDFDKVYIATLDDEGSRFRLAVREFEIPSYQAAEVRRTDAGSLEEIPRGLRGLLERSFTRLARLENDYELESTVETPDGPKPKRQARASVRFRAAGLQTDGTALLVPPVGAPMSVVLRSDDRLGNPRPGGVAEMEFTYVLADKVEGSLVDGPVYTGLRFPFGARSNRRLKRFVRYVPYSQGDTALSVVTPAREDEPSEPLGGYDIYARDPESDDSTLLGETDWRGRLAISPGSQALRILYVKSGDRLLARLPVAPGLKANVTAVVPDDSFRLEAEGAIAAFQSRMTDLIARRQALAVRIRRKVEQKQLAEAQKMLDEEFKPMFDRTGLTYELEELRKRFSTDDPIASKRIETMFNTTREVLNKFLDTDLDRQLEAQIKQAGGSA